MKIRIKRANTERAGVVLTGYIMSLSLSDVDDMADYIDELRQQPKWNAEKCKS